MSESKFINFRREIYNTFPNRCDAIMNLLDALSSYGQNVNSVVKLSKAPCFKRQYSSITDAIADGAVFIDWDEIMRIIFKSEPKMDKKLNRFILDCTANPRPFAKKLPDRCIVHAPNPAPGNKPICVGHQYSACVMLSNNKAAQEKHWVIPMETKRVPFQEKGNEFGMKQMGSIIAELQLENELNLSIGDSLYATENCRKTVDSQKNWVHLFRINSKRNLYSQPKLKPKKGVGRKLEYGEKIILGDPSTHPKPDTIDEIKGASRTGVHYTITIKYWNNLLVRGSRDYRAALHPLNVAQVSIIDENGKSKFKRPIWLGIHGERRNEIDGISAHEYYMNRSDIEHFFRFGKNNLHMNNYQTSDIEHEEAWWNLCSLAYAQLYEARQLTPAVPESWEKYLPQYKNMKDKNCIATPSQSQRGFEKLLEIIGTPAAACIARGNPRGRMEGDNQIKKEYQPVLYKNKKTKNSDQKNKVLSSEISSKNSNPKTIEALIDDLIKELKCLNIPQDVFVKMLENHH